MKNHPINAALGGIIRATCCAVTLATLTAVATAAGQIVKINGHDASANRVIFAEKAGITAAQRGNIASTIGAGTFEDIGGGAKVATLPPGADVKTLIAKLKQNPAVRYAEPDYRVHALGVPNDPLIDQQWALRKIAAPAAWNVLTGTDRIIAVLDTGSGSHPDLAPNMWKNSGEIPGDGIDNDRNGFVDDVYGVDFLKLTGNPIDDNGHGTHVASEAAAAGNNGIGTCGVVQRARIMSLKFLDEFGNGDNSNAVLAIRYATKNRASVINASFGGGDFSQAVKDAIDEAGAVRIVVVCAAGNNDYGLNIDTVPLYPASYTSANIVSVGASTEGDGVAVFSNYGPKSVDIFAPGDLILGAVPGGNYSLYSGTSMAAPIVAGVLALTQERYPNDNVAQIIKRVLDGADRLPAFQGRCVTGGRVNLAKVIGAVPPPTDDHSDDPYVSSTPIAPNSTTTGRIESRPDNGRDNDWLRIYVARAGTLELWTTGDMNTYGYLCGAKDKGFPILAEDNDSGGNRQFRLRVRVSGPGHYYPRVRGFGGATGSYELHSSFR